MTINNCDYDAMNYDDLVFYLIYVSLLNIMLFQWVLKKQNLILLNL